jgi:hypothetical protein
MRNFESRDLAKIPARILDGRNSWTYRYLLGTGMDAFETNRFAD